MSKSQGTTFNSGGSNVNNPTAGLNTNQGLFSGMNSSNASMANQPGLMQQYQSTAPIKKIVSGDTQVHFDNTNSNSPSNPGKVTGVLAPKNTSSSTGTGGSSPTTPTTPTAKAPDDPSNQFRTDNGQPNTNWVNYKAPANPLTVAGAAPVVSASGGQTDQEKQTYAGLLNQSQNESPQVADARQQLVDYNRQLAQTDKNISAQGISLDSARGQLANVGQAATAEEAALQGGVTNALASQSQQITAGTAANTAAQTQAGRATGVAENVLSAVAPIQVPYSNQIIQPGMLGSNGANTNGTGTAMSQLPKQAQDTINSYAQQVKSGAMTRPDAESRLSAYGVVGTNALNEVLGPNFNTNASNASAGTTAVGQQIQTAATATNQALDTLSELFNNLSPLQTGGIPLTNSLSNWVATNLGDKALSQYKTNLADARSQLIGVLNSAGGTPTGNEATANQYLPDNMTKAQFDANVGTTQNPGIVRQLVAQKVGSFTGSGSQNSSGGTTGGFSEGTKSSDGSLIYKGGKWVKS